MIRRSALRAAAAVAGAVGLAVARARVAHTPTLGETTPDVAGVADAEVSCETDGESRTPGSNDTEP
ncbi:hypothetical protein [Mobilicoccus massiliensis]|uniref:hypothetical protein n=1 Tax=Mobilicoccus massiliensis TaxID=1522310 RepID=UPI00114343D6|nr:hypothetical protein [Mobilicoccus massiliensis]